MITDEHLCVRFMGLCDRMNDIREIMVHKIDSKCLIFRSFKHFPVKIGFVNCR